MVIHCFIDVKTKSKDEKGNTLSHKVKWNKDSCVYCSSKWVSYVLPTATKTLTKTTISMKRVGDSALVRKIALTHIELSLLKNLKACKSSVGYGLQKSSPQHNRP